MLGAEILIDFFRNDGIDLSHNYNDCGLMIYSREEQDVHAGGSAAAARQAFWPAICWMACAGGVGNTFAATGALLSPTSTQQGESILHLLRRIDINDEINEGLKWIFFWSI